MSDQDRPRILQMVAAPPGLFAQFVGEWEPKRDDGSWRRREEWSEPVFVFGLCEWPDGEQQLHALSVAPEGEPVWLTDAVCLTFLPNDGPRRMPQVPPGYAPHELSRHP